MKSINIMLSSLALSLTIGLASCAGSSNDNQNNATVDEIAVEETTVFTSNAPAKLIELAENQVLDLDKGLGYPVVIDFNATWCGPCVAFSPIFKAAAEKYNGKIQFISVDVDKCPQVAQKYQVESIPYVLYVTKDGKISSSIGLMGDAEFDAQLQKLL